MASEIKKEIQLEIAHVLFMDIVGYSKLLINEQRALLEELNQIVRSTGEFQNAEAAGKLIKIPTGDGMALVFYKSPEEPVECALEISRALKTHPNLPLRMGVHSGPVSGVIDVNERANVAGAGINMAQRVMDCGDDGHILLSKHVAEDLEQYGHWQPLLHDLGECEVKHGVRVHITNLFTEELGNPESPQKFKQLRGKKKMGSAISGPSARPPRLKWIMIGAVVVIAVGLAATIPMFTHRPSSKSVSPAARQISEKSVAVLPFENLSRDPDNAYFATGIQDEILTRLAKVSALKVISRTSTQQYAAKPGNLSEIGRQLNVANILEGSVQKAGDQVHINAQLIRAATDEHLWAESYDRKLENIFGVEAEVATAVADALKAKLSGAEHQALEQRPTRNAGAYDAYLRGLAYYFRPGWNQRDNTAAIEAFEHAVKLDPEFALGWASLARQRALGYFNSTGDNPNYLREAAREAAKKAAALQPDLADAFLADGYVKYYCDANYDAAIVSFERAGKLAPRNSEVPKALGLVYRRKGERQRSIDYFQQALELSPADTMLLNEQAGNFEALGQYPQALKIIDRLLEIIPTNPAALAYKVAIYQDQGDLTSAADILAGLHIDASSPWVLTQMQLQQWKYERRYTDAVNLLKAVLEKPNADFDGEKLDDQASLAMVEQLSNDTVAARRNWEEIRAKIEEKRRSKGKDFLTPQLAAAYVALGNKTKAFSVIKEAAEAFSQRRPNDAMARSWIPEMTARIAAQAGEKDLALEQLATAANEPLGLNYGDLKFSPDWDVLRGDPRFEKIVASLAPK